ncbi:MAG TPA: RNA polymerase sigma factor [Candidatus Kaiserbacteria bacterium]|nr:RNA polymerase sigma factor [Candidatus Kaiserbacteria bacterium]
MPTVAYYGIMITQSMSISNSRRYAMKLSDEEVLRLSVRHPDMFAILVERYEKPFYRRARAVIKVHEDAQEIVQDTFTRIYLFTNKYKQQEGARFSSWAYTILNRVAFTHYQKLKRINSAIAPLTVEHYEALPDSAENTFATLTVRDEVLRTLAQLPETAARVLRLQFLEGYTQKEMARKEGTTVSAIKTRVHRAKKMFMKTFK